jgi:hypothetical protein
MKIFDDLKAKLTYDKPVAMQWHEWDEWEAKMQKERPLAYWLNETVPDFFDDIYNFITKPFNDLRYWIRYRVFDKYHIINTGLEPGYHDCDERMLHGMFNMLVDFVEIEKAWMCVVFSTENRKKYNYPWFSLGWLRVKNFRCREAGLDHLDWEYSLGNPNLNQYDRCESQSANAAEILYLYKWWTEERPNRPDYMDVSGWSAWCDHRDRKGYKLFTDKDYTPEEKIEERRILDLSRKIEEQHAQEDTDMLIRLVKIRRSLWT